MGAEASLAEAIHDLQARLGSIRIAVTAVLGLDLDADTRNDMLMSASNEALRASAELAAIGALAACTPDRITVAVSEALHTSARVAQLGGVEVEVVVADGSVSVAPQFEAGLAALLRVVSGAGAAVRIAAATGTETVGMRLDRIGGDAGPLPAVAASLAVALGGTVVCADAGLEFTLEAP